MKEEITPIEYGMLPAYLHSCYEQVKPYENYFLKNLNDTNKIAMLYQTAKNLSYGNFIERFQKEFMQEN